MMCSLLTPCTYAKQLEAFLGKLVAEEKLCVDKNVFSRKVG